MNPLTKALPDSSRQYDLSCLGRLAVDFYGQQIGSRLEDVDSFAKYLGGSSANIAAGSARLGLRVSMLSRVGDEQLGRFLVEELQREGCDTSQVQIDSERLTALAILSIRSKDAFPLLFYRDNCADMAIAAEDIKEAHIAASRALLITGTHFSTPGVMAASMQALAYAKKHETFRVLDIDYRPVLWGLTDKGDGDTRYIASDRVTEHMQKILPHFQLIVGTEEECNIAGGAGNLIESLRVIRSHTAATILVKLGASGCAIVDGAIPDSIDQAYRYTGFEVDVLNVLGAGDAFMSGFLFGLLRAKDYETCCTLANACGALVVSRHACSPAMPTPAELEHFLAHRTEIDRIDLDPQLNLLHRISQKDVKREEMAILAFDHRKQFVDMARACGAPLEKIAEVKKLILNAYLETIKKQNMQHRAGVLIDDTWGDSLLMQVSGSGMWIGRPVEQPASRPIEFEGGRNIGQQLISWPKDHVVKCLVFYHPDDPSELRYEQERQIGELYKACNLSGHKLLLEIIPPDGVAEVDVLIPRIMERLYNLNIHPFWWKLPPLPKATWEIVETIIEERSPWCRGILLLGLGQDFDSLAKGFEASAGQKLCKGFAIGRSVFHQPVQEWLRGSTSDDACMQHISENYLRLVEIWDRSRS